ncbi:MAG: hypothetical protein ABSF24_03900 [Candidatus Bathyarchaeia archaeon]
MDDDATTGIVPTYLNWNSASQHINETLELQELGLRLDLDEIESFRSSLKSCPECSSTEGFWLVAKSDKTYFQCKHCAAILEVCEILQHSKASKDSKRFLGKLRT